MATPDAADDRDPAERARAEYRAAWPIDSTLIWFATLTVAWFAWRDSNPVQNTLNPPAIDDQAMAAAPGAPGMPGIPGAVAQPPADSTPAPPLPPKWTAKSHTTFTGEPIADVDRLDGFYRALARVTDKQPGAMLRIGQFGDSITANDAISVRARGRLQDSFGDGGAGFIYLAPPSRHYRHLSVQQRAGAGWKIRSITGAPAADHLYGVGGASFESSSAEVSLTTMKEGTGARVSSYELYFLKQPRGGHFELAVDGELKADIDTAADVVASGFARIDVADGAHKLTVRAKGGSARGFGVALERPGPAVVWDNYGLVSSSSKALKNIESAHWQEQLRHRGLDLAVIYLGANEADWLTPSRASLAEHEQNYGVMLGKLRAALPDGSSCLVMSPTDAAAIIDGKWVTKPSIPGMVEAQRAAASKNGCAFWDAFKWMGGKGSVLKWRRQNDWEPDLTHPNRTGGARVADGLIDALLAGYDAFREKHP